MNRAQRRRHYPEMTKVRKGIHSRPREVVYKILKKKNECGWRIGWDSVESGGRVNGN